MKTVFFIVDKPLHGDSRAQEFLDIALMAAAFEQRVVLLFEGEGVLALMKNQQAEVLGLKNTVPLLSALPVYDINEVIVEKESIEHWGLNSNELVIQVEERPRTMIKQQLGLADHVFSF